MIELPLTPVDPDEVRLIETVELDGELTPGIDEDIVKESLDMATELELGIVTDEELDLEAMPLALDDNFDTDDDWDLSMDDDDIDPEELGPDPFDTDFD